MNKTVRTILNLIESTLGSAKFDSEINYDVEHKIYLSKEEIPSLNEVEKGTLLHVIIGKT